MDLGLEGRVAVVAASSKGLGRAVADAWQPRASALSSPPEVRRRWPVPRQRSGRVVPR